ncbi:MAG: hypothetical protein QOG28_3896 [Trebonia sp.]|nr:hypothetical protein [Trebonia sp.]
MGQPGEGRGTGGEPVPGPAAPGGSDSSGPSNALSGPARHGETPRDERLSGFTRGGEWDACLPGPELAAVLTAVAGPQWRCPGAESDELIGVLRRLAALESWASAAKLAAIRELIRQDDLPFPARPRHGDLPDEWSGSVNHEIALALAVSVQSAEKTALTAWELGARLPGIAALHADGTLAYSKARLIAETFQWLTDEDAAKAEAMILPQLTGTTGKTYGQIMNLAARIANEVDPGLAERRRKAATKHASRVQMYREQSGAAALSGRDLPTDETLAAYANVAARAAEYKDSGAFPDARMDQLRATAYLDLINGRPADIRIAHGHLSTDTPDAEATPDTESTVDLGDSDPGEDSTGRGAGKQPVPVPSQGQPGGRPVLADLIFPLATLLGLADRPGEGHGLGVLDPELCRDLAELAAASPHSRLCVTVTDPDGIAIGHGCGRTRKPAGAPPGHIQAGTRPPPVALPARVNLTITADRLSVMLAGVPGSPGKSGERGSPGWTLTPCDAGDPSGSASRPGSLRTRGSPDDPNWCGTWELTLPGGQELAVRIEPVPTHDCDHRHESHGYEPNDTLRHLVQVRDYTCTFPPCSRHARDSDFEHAQPYDKGGRTCSCNAGARSRKCHRVKQSPGWKVTQPKPGWHEWTTPSGRTYTQGPYRYPV